jgi:hypothetical protein
VKSARKILAGLAIALGLFQLVRLAVLVDRFTIDVPYWDQWTFYQADFAPHSVWERFTWQHGPHRQGLGAPLTAAVNRLSGWNQRAVCFSIVAIMMAAAAAALALKRRLAGALTWTDVGLVLLLLTPQQLALYTQVPNLSHGALPLLLVLLTALAWTLRPAPLRYLLVVALTLLALFTGFGLFLGVAVPLLLALEVVRVRRHGPVREAVAPLLAGVALAAGWALFFVGYRSASVPPELANIHPAWSDYPVFVALQFGNLFGVRGTEWGPRLAGFVALAALLVVAVRALRRWLGEPNGTAASFARSVLLLILFSMLFAGGSSAGRMLLGLEGARACRYLPLLMPAAVGLHLWLAQRASPRLRVLFLLILAATCLPWRERRDARRYAKGKAAWVQAYRATGDVDKANAWAKFPIFPGGPAATRAPLHTGLDWLERNQFSFFRDRASAGP